MAQYKAIYIERNYTFKTGDDVEMSFVVYDANGALVSSFTNTKIKAYIYGGGADTELANTAAGGGDTQISITGNIITIHIPLADTVDYSYDTDITVELQIEIGTKIYTVYSDLLWFEEELLDF